MEQRNLLLAIVLSVAILLSFELLYKGPQQESQGPQQTTESTSQDGGGKTQPQASGGGQTQPQAKGDGTAPQAGSSGTAPDATAGGGAGMPETGTAQAKAPTRDQVLADADNRIRIDTPKVRGSISLVGGRIDDITLTTYRRELDPDSEKVHILSPKGSRDAYYAAFGWSGVAGTGVELPTPDTQWTTDDKRLSPGNDVTLTWTNESGLTFERVYSIDRDYMVTVTQRVTNNAAEAVSLAPYGLISRRGTPEVSRLYILHEGPLGVIDGTLDEHDYGDLQDEGIIANDTQGGWIGMTDKYWLASLVPDQDAKVKTRFVHNKDAGVNKYQTDILYETKRVAPGATVSQTSRVFAGAKEVAVLDRYKDELGVPMFDKAVDFGWFYFLNKPLFRVLIFFENLTGNFGIAIFMLVVCIKIVFFPLANKSYRSMAKMRKLQPEMQRLREQFGDDKQRLNQEMMALYKQEGANPASGCLPILIQIPVFFALYKVLLVTIEMRHAPFFGWIQDLSAKDPTAVTNLFGLMPWGVPELGPLDILNVGVLPIFMGFTMYAQQLLNPQPADATQAKIFRLLPFFFTFILGQFPAGLVVYWTSNNLLTAAQQYVIMKRAGDKPGQKSAAPPPKPQQKGGGSKAGGGTGGGNGSAEPPADDAAEPAGGPAPVPAGAAANAANTGVGDAATRASPSTGGSSNPAAKSAKGRGKGKKGRKR